MQNDIQQERWIEFFDDFSRRNLNRTIRLEIFSDLGAQPEAEHLPFGGISVDAHGAEAPRLEVMLGSDSDLAAPHLTHSISHVRRIAIKEGADGEDDALEIESDDGAKTLLSFETRAAA